ncbi:unnamed protein product [Blepharisma stoltei]|uniref:ODAD1 central coiled coil region domain-containing protein n=1 Tax=Blepharisma stoltei TaxID=1481888 RepID=A0AAU9IF63_9CILI|nr:unnamed protein product [Blepharisma stoltei]
MISPYNRTFASSSKINTTLREPEVDTLQRQLDSLTIKLEHERRQSSYLDEQIRLAELDLKGKTDKDSAAKQNPGKSLQFKLQKLERKLCLELNQCNDTANENNELKLQIEEHRRDKMHYKRNLDSLKEDMIRYSIKAKVQNKETRKGSESVDRQREKIQMMRSRSVLLRNKYGNRVTQLQSVLREERASRFRFIKEIENSNIQKANLGIADTINGLLARWKRICKGKKKALDFYIKNIKVLENAFDQIREATGMARIEEIVTAFIKSEDQNYELCSYINKLNSEIDSLEEALKRSTQFMTSYQESKDSRDKKGNDYKSNLENRFARVKRKNSQKISQLFAVQNGTNAIGPVIWKIQVLCKSTSLDIRFPSSHNFNNEESLSEDHLVTALGEIEEYINYILLLQNQDQGELNTTLKTIPLDILNEKSFEKKPPAIDNIFLTTSDLYDEHTLDEFHHPLTTSDLQLKARTIYDASLTFDTSAKKTGFKFDNI